MGIFDDIKNTADAHEAQVEAGIDQAGDFADSKTGGKYAGQVDQAQEFLKDQVGAPNEAPAEPAPAPEEPA
ncbi:MAG: antitoxin [Propionibacteriaceae bacterium]|nr:antitoxin [Propionibacteriaceae bacterium]